MDIVNKYNEMPFIGHCDLGALDAMNTEHRSVHPMSCMVFSKYNEDRTKVEIHGEFDPLSPKRMLFNKGFGLVGQVFHKLFNNGKILIVPLCGFFLVLGSDEYKNTTENDKHIIYTVKGSIPIIECGNDKTFDVQINVQKHKTNGYVSGIKFMIDIDTFNEWKCMIPHYINKTNFDSSSESE